MVAHAMVLGLGVVGLLWAGSVAAQTQQAEKTHRIGYVSSGSPSQPEEDPFRQGLRDAGYVEGKDIVVEARFARGRQELLPKLVAEVLRLDVDVLVVVSTRTAIAAKEATSTIPIVFASVFDPVAAGLVASLANPGGNITGVAMGVGGGFGGKWVEFLKYAVPGISHAAVLWNSANQSSAQCAEEIQAAARTLGLTLDMFDAGNASELDKALTAIGAGRAQGITSHPTRISMPIV